MIDKSISRVGESEMSDILDVVLPLAEMTIIKRDFDLLKKLIMKLPDEVKVQMVPFSALFCYEVNQYLSNHGYAIEMEQTGRYSIKDIRQKAKFFDLSVNKLLQSIENVDQLQNDYFIQQMKYPELGCWNAHTNLGVYFDAEKHIVGNTHYAYYVFQDEKMISRPRDSMSGHDLIGEEIQAFGYDMGRIIGSISDGLSQISDFMVADVDPNTLELFSQDFNTNRCVTVGNDKYKLVRLFLLHVLSSIGFVLHILKKAIIRDSGLLLRLEYITYHFALLRLDGIANYCRQNSRTVNDPKLMELLSGIDYMDTKGLRKPEFRNCMMHFGLTDKDGKSLINESCMDLSKPFCGLVEGLFGKSYGEYQVSIETELSTIFTGISQYLDFDLSLPEGK